MDTLVVCLCLIAVALPSLAYPQADGNYTLGKRTPRSSFPKMMRNTAERTVKRIYPRAVPGEQCRRPCDGRPRVCYFEYTMEQYSVLGPACGNCSNGVQEDCTRPQCLVVDGFQRVTVTPNRQIPGPPMEMCRNDRVLIQINNDLPEQATTLHCHGLTQETSPWMDGVPGVTQCPIQPGNTFIYNFLVPKAGTYWCHSHLGAQKLDSIAIAFIVRLENDPLSKMYDEDRHIIMVQDWTHIPALQFIPGIHNQSFFQLPDNVLINGRGKYSESGADPRIPWEVLEVEAGKRYRMRLIAATCMTCPYCLKVDSHRLTVVTTDGGNRIEPTPVDTVCFNPADRMDFILRANQTPGIYPVYVQGLDFCSHIQQIALLKYRESRTDLNSVAVNRNVGSLGVMLNYPNATCDGTNKSHICFDMVNGETDAPSFRSHPGYSYYQSNVSLGSQTFTPDELFQPGKYDRYEEPTYGRLAVYTLNNCEHASAPSPLLTQFYDNPPGTFCDSCSPTSGGPRPGEQCTHLVNLPLGAIVDLIFVDTGARDEFNHPMHIHGYDFWILDLGLFPGDMSTADKFNFLSRKARMGNFNTRRRVVKDSISVPASGYAVLRIVTDNPGYWILHCHFEFHLENGMALVYQVGEREQMLMPSGTFPRCGNYYGV